MLNLDDPNFFHRFPAFHLSGEVNELCKPVFNAINANYFDYNRVYPDNTFLTLSSDIYWLEHFFKRKFKLCTAFQQSGMHLWDGYYYQPATHEARIHFNHAHGISIIYKQNDYIEYIDIAASKEQGIITSYYLNQTDMIHQLINDFRERSQGLIKIAEKNVVQLPTIITDGTLEDLSQNKYSLAKFNLSTREKQCMEYYFLGKTAKETAEALQLSRRTIEEYLESVKKKLKCRHKRDLIKYFYYK